MDASVRIGKVAGIEIYVSWTLAIAFVLIAWTLAGQFLPSLVPSQSQTTYWLAAIVAVVLFYASLLAHEFGHALVARRVNVTVDRITLWVFGGVARLRGDVGSPGDEAKIAIAGPVVSTALGIGFGAAFSGLNNNVPDIVVGPILWLASSNLLLAVFNLIPAFPLDGGRLLRAALWKRSGDLYRATSSAARVGRLFAFVMIGGGVLMLFTQSAFSGLWLVVLGWFLYTAARGEESHTMLRGTLSVMRVSDVMQSNLAMYPGWITVDEFLRTYLPNYRLTAYPLKNFDGAVDGLVTLTRLSEVPSELRRTTRVRDVGCGLDEVAQASPSEPVSALLDRFTGCGEGHVLVIDGATLVGMVTPVDITRAMGAGTLRR